MIQSLRKPVVRRRMVLIVASLCLIGLIVTALAFIVYDFQLKKRCVSNLVRIVNILTLSSDANLETNEGVLKRLISSGELQPEDVIDPRSGRRYSIEAWFADSDKSEVVAFSPLAPSPVEWVYRLFGSNGYGGAVMFRDGHAGWCRESEYLVLIRRTPASQ